MLIKRFLYSSLLPLLFISCDDSITCDNTFNSYNVFVKDSVQFIIVKDVTNDTIISVDSLVIGETEIINDNYFSKIGPDNTININTYYRFLKDTVDTRIYAKCISTDKCHININPKLDTLK
jgi:hypothetical protein